MTADSPEDPPVLFVTGLLGAGKTTALAALEDLGWEVVDNFPIRLIERLLGDDGDGAGDAGPGGGGADLERGADAGLAIGFDSRTRGFDPAAIIARLADLRARPGRRVALLFLDCATGELERRYNETRRRHPQAAGTPLRAGIVAEREALAPLRRMADAVIDTSELSTADLKHTIRDRFAASGTGPVVTIMSFGFARGMPPLADFVFDMRFLANPYWDLALRPLTGHDPAVAAAIAADPAWDEAFGHIAALLRRLLPRYAAQGKGYVTIAFGCTGGRHRSVFAAQQLAATLREAGFAPTVVDRNLGSQAAELIEGPPQT